MYKRYINIPQAPNPDIGAKKLAINLNNRLKLFIN